MKVTGIIAEYNPFHNGHAYHLERSRQMTGADCIVCIMSGDFTQRGEAALWDKWTRAEMAVRNGADLVLELPFVFACNNAELFARGGMEILNRLGCITDVVFGSECGDLEPLRKIADLLSEEPPEFQQRLHENLDQGNSFPAARAEAISYLLGAEYAGILSDPNNILGIEYLKQAKRLGSSILFHTLKRQGEGYHSHKWQESMASASSIRKHFLETGSLQGLDGSMPVETMNVIKRIDDCVYEKLNQMDMLLRYKIRTSQQSWLREIYSVTEGLENKLKKAVTCQPGLSTLIGELKSKRYTHTRICRVLCHVIMGLSRADMEAIQDHGLVYGRVLGFSDRGAALLRTLKKQELTSLPIITNLKQQQMNEMEEELTLSYDVLASDLWNLMVYGNIYSHSDFVKMPYMANGGKKA